MGCSNGKSLNNETERIYNIQINNEQVKDPFHLSEDVINASLKNFKYDSINQFANSLKTYYKNQLPPSDTSKPFTDPLFPPNAYSIFGYNAKGKLIDTEQSRRTESSKYFKVDKKNIIWLRPEEIFEGPYSVFEGKIEAGDTIQGSVGDCYFLSALSAMAEFPQMICQIFKTLTISPNGCYEIALRLNGKWKIVIVDDLFPCSKLTKLPIFCKPNGNEIWTMLLEKAWAKINAGYVNIDAGFTIEVLNALTPFPTQILNHADYSEDELWSIINNADRQGHILTCITKFDSNIEKYGLIPGHSCTLCNAFERLVRGITIRLLKVRNPWSYKEWSGRYSDNSPEWDEETKKAFGEVEIKDDGFFWIEFSDYLNFFEETEICKTKNYICVKNIQISKDRALLPNIFQLKINIKSSVDISILRKSYRYNRKIISNEEIISNLILIKIIPEWNIEIIDTNSSSKRSCIISKVLEPGDYLIYFHVDYEKGIYDKIRKYSIDVASTEYFNLYDKGMDRNFKFLQKVIKDHVEAQDPKKFKEHSCKHIIEDCNSGLLETTYGYLFLKNVSDIPHTIEIKPELKNLYFIEDTYRYLNADENNPSFSDTFKFILAANQAFILITNTIDFYKDAEMSFDYHKFHSKNPAYKKAATNKVSPIISEFLADPIEANCYQYSSYSFIYNRVNFDIKDIVQRIDAKEIAIKKLKEKYPKDMEELLKMPPLKDNEDVIFRDRYYIGRDYYFGEQHNASMIRHGRGKYYWDADKVIFFGYSVKGQFNGKGKFIYPSGEIHEGNFKNGKLLGKGRIYKDGKWIEANFPL